MGDEMMQTHIFWYVANKSYNYRCVHWLAVFCFMDITSDKIYYVNFCYSKSSKARCRSALLFTIDEFPYSRWDMNGVEFHAAKSLSKNPVLLSGLFPFVHNKAEFPMNQAEATLHRYGGSPEAVLLVSGPQFFRDGFQVFEKFSLRQFHGRCVALCSIWVDRLCDLPSARLSSKQ